MTCTLKLILKNNTYRILENCLSFSFEKELYMPFTKSSGRFFLPSAADFDVRNVMTVELYLDGILRHCGLPDNITIRPYAGGRIISFVSRGYTLLLMQNEPYPEINTNVTLKSLVERNMTVPQIVCEDPTPTERYIYVKEKSTVWDAVVAYSIKALGNYPYVRSTNTVCVNIGSRGVINYSSSTLIDEGRALDTSNILSDVHMIDEDLGVQYDAHDQDAEDIGIVRSKYYPLDKQWLYSPQTGLQAKLDYSNRAIKQSFFTYTGCLSEDIMDTIQGTALNGLRISCIHTWGNKNGIFTTVSSYHDRYAQRT